MMMGGAVRPAPPSSSSMRPGVGGGVVRTLTITPSTTCYDFPLPPIPTYMCPKCLSYLQHNDNDNKDGGECGMECDDRPFPDQWHKYSNLVRPSKLACGQPWHERHASGAIDLEFQLEYEENEEAANEATAAALRDDARRRYGAVHLWIKEQRRKKAKLASLEFRQPKDAVMVVVRRHPVASASSSIAATTTTTTTTTPPATTTSFTVEPPTTKPGPNRTIRPSSFLRTMVTPQTERLHYLSSTSVAVEAATGQAPLAPSSSMSFSKLENPRLKWVHEAVATIPDQQPPDAARIPRKLLSHSLSARWKAPVPENSSSSVASYAVVASSSSPPPTPFEWGIMPTIPRKPVADARHDAARLESYVAAAQDQQRQLQQATTAAATTTTKHPPSHAAPSTAPPHTTDPAVSSSSSSLLLLLSSPCSVSDSSKSSSSSTNSSDASSASSSTDHRTILTTTTTNTRTTTKVMLRPSPNATVRIPRKRRLPSTSALAIAMPTNPCDLDATTNYHQQRQVRFQLGSDGVQPTVAPPLPKRRHITSTPPPPPPPEVPRIAAREGPPLASSMSHAASQQQSTDTDAAMDDSVPPPTTADASILPATGLTAQVSTPSGTATPQSQQLGANGDRASYSPTRNVITAALLASSTLSFTTSIAPTEATHIGATTRLSQQGDSGGQASTDPAGSANSAATVQTQVHAQQTPSTAPVPGTPVQVRVVPSIAPSPQRAKTVQAKEISRTNIWVSTPLPLPPKKKRASLTTTTPSQCPPDIYASALAASWRTQSVQAVAALLTIPSRHPDETCGSRKKTTKGQQRQFLAATDTSQAQSFGEVGSRIERSPFQESIQLWLRDNQTDDPPKSDTGDVTVFSAITELCQAAPVSNAAPTIPVPQNADLSPCLKIEVPGTTLSPSHPLPAHPTDACPLSAVRPTAAAAQLPLDPPPVFPFRSAGQIQAASNLQIRSLRKKAAETSLSKSGAKQETCHQATLIDTADAASTAPADGPASPPLSQWCPQCSTSLISSLSWEKLEGLVQQTVTEAMKHSMEKLLQESIQGLIRQMVRDAVDEALHASVQPAREVVAQAGREATSFCLIDAVKCLVAEAINERVGTLTSGPHGLLTSDPNGLRTAGPNGLLTSDPNGLRTAGPNGIRSATPRQD